MQPCLSLACVPKSSFWAAPRVVQAGVFSRTSCSCRLLQLRNSDVARLFRLTPPFRRLEGSRLMALQRAGADGSLEALV